MALPRLETERLVLSPVAASDASALHRLWTDPDVRRYLWDDVLIPESRAAEMVTECRRLAEEEGIGMWTITRQEGAHGVEGFVALKHPAGSKEVELMYGLAPALWGLGLATEASFEVLRYAFATLALTRVVAGADPPNTRSFTVMRRLGMKPLEEAIGTAAGVLYFAIDAEEFRTLAAR